MKAPHGPTHARRRNRDEQREAEAQRLQAALAGQRASEEALRACEARYRSLVDLSSGEHATAEQSLGLLAIAAESAANGIVITDRKGTILWANAAFQELTGYSLAEAVGKSPRILKSGRHPDEFYRNLWQTVSDGKVWRGELINRRKDGSLYSEEMTITPVRTGGSEITHFVAIKQDVTARKRTEEALRESELFYRQTLESTPAMTFTTRPDGYCDYQSQQWVDYTGIPMGEHLGDGWNRLLHPEDRPRAFAAWRAAVEGRAPYDIEYRVRRHDGVYQWFKVQGRPICNAAGEIVRWFGTALNIDDLVNARAELVRSLKDKEVLLQEIHHRVKNNLQIISSVIGLQADASKEPGLNACLEDVRDRVRAMALVHEKLYESGDLARLDFADYLSGLLAFLWRVHGAAAAKIRLKLHAEPIALAIDKAVPSGLILNELASNTLKHAFPHRLEGEVQVSLSREVGAGRVCLRVADNGIGLPPGFNWREAPSLGLRLVQMLAEQINGTVEATGGPGTEFRVVFPVQ